MALNVRRLNALGPVLSRSLRPAVSKPILSQYRNASKYNEPAMGRDAVEQSMTDPSMNGGYINPPPLKRVLRDPYADWWDKQERRNFGEPVHEDNDILGVFSTDPYTHAKPVVAWASMGAFVASVFGLCWVVAQYYPDKPSAPRTFPSGLETELGGSKALLARKEGEDSY